MEEYEIILDTDIGDDIDDAYALALLMAEKANLLGVTTVYRNAVQRAKIAARLIGLWQRNIPVYAGESYPEKQPLFRFDKADEGNVPNIPHYIPGEMQSEKIGGENAVDFILNALRARPHEITILAIGPFTNLAAAIKKDKNAFLLAKEVVIMGGDYTESEAEWNVLCDPEAAAALFSSGVKIRAVGVDVTQRCRFSPETLAYLRALKNPKNRLLFRMTEIWIAHNAERGVPPTMHDPLTAETLFHKDLVRFETGRYEVCLTGEKRGFTQKSETGAQIEYAAAANVPKFMEILKNNLSREDRRGGTNE